jgi:N-acetylglucosaminyl-diphospho-decaprenol L-rhamnosyltransferase
MLDVSAIVVTHNSESEIEACLDALRGCGQVGVVDNASVDGTVALAAKRHRVEVMANPNNRGFAAAVNQGARSALGRYLLILNPDAVVSTSCEGLMKACEQSGIASGCLTTAAGTPQKGFVIRRLPTPTMLVFECLGLNAVWPGNPVNVRYRCLDLDLTRPGPVEQPAGAFMMIRRDVFEKLGGFDERFWPVWYEDVDFCRRAIDAGYGIQYRPEARARHLGAHSVKNIQPKYQRLYWYGSLLRYAGKHYRPLAFRTVCCSVLFGSLLRLLAGMLRRGGPQGEYNKVLRLAAASLLAGHLVYPAAVDGWEDGRRPLQSHPVDGR